MQEELFHSRYCIYQRTGSDYFYVQYWNPQSKKYGTARSTGKTNGHAAEHVAQEWLASYGGPPPLPTKHSDFSKEEVNYYLTGYMLSKGLLAQGQTCDIDQLLQQASLSASPAEHEKDNPIFADYLVAFWDWETSGYVKDKLDAGQRIGKPYCDANKSYMRTYAVPYFKDIRLLSITPAVLKSFKDHFPRFSPDHPKGLKPKTIRDIMGCISKALEEATKLQTIPYNPAKALFRIALTEKARQILTLDEAERVLSLDWPDPRSKLASQLAASHGMRAGEIAGLRIEQLDFEHNVIDINRSWERQGKKLKSTKTNKNRLIHTDKYVLEQLKNLYAMNPFDNGYIFGDPANPDRPMSPDLFLDHLRAALERIGISRKEQSERGIDFQAWRHFSNSFFRGDIPDSVLRSEIGHSTDQMTEHYFHLTEEQGEQYRAVYQTKLLPHIFPEKKVA